jgi:two-component system, NarL family, nitrate/nitrite response regulator NarL
MRVLIVDDHLIWRKTLRTFLSVFSDVEVIGEVQDGYDALHACQELNPDLVLLDIHMPGMDGFETAQAILRQNSQTSIIGLSAEVSPATQQRALECGFHAALSKDEVTEKLPVLIRQLQHRPMSHLNLPMI